MNQDLPLVSVIMNAYNAELYISEAINSVLEQTYENWELIVWDNHSKDNTSQLVNNFDDDRIKYNFSEEFTPLGEARNLAISNSKGSLIAFLDSDDIWFPDKLEKQVPLFESDNVGIVISDSIFFNANEKSYQIYKKNKPDTGSVFRKLFSNYFISLETAIVRKSALDKLDHLFDKRFNMVEEYDLFVRLSMDWELDYVDKVLAKWRVHEGSWTWSKEKDFPKEKRLMLEKYISTIPNFALDYSEEIIQFSRGFSLEEAIIEWKEGNNVTSRKILKPYLFSGIKWFFLYFLTFFPITLYETIQKVRGSVRPG